MNVLTDEVDDISGLCHAVGVVVARFPVSVRCRA